jgi:D-arabinose 1-dehydrogenase-like Zn-dependent alcohol dehydrogenase
LKALRLEKIGKLAMAEIPLPRAGKDETVLKVTHCAVCRTDAKMWRIGHRDLLLPRIPGHEICGISEKTGRRAVVWPGRSCGCCEPCRTGAENLCREMRIIGFHEDGGFAEYVRVPDSSLLEIPGDLPGSIAVLAEPLACAVNALQQADMAPDENVLIYGAGPVGLLLAMAVKAGGGRPFLKEIRPEKLQRTESFRRRIGALPCEQKRYDVVINAAPSTETFIEGMTRLDFGGRFCLFSGLTDDRRVPAALLNEIHYRQLRVSGAYGCTRAQMTSALGILDDFRDVVELLIEARIPLASVPVVLPAVADGLALKTIVDF